jgi:hypothetical protein
MRRADADKLGRKGIPTLILPNGVWPRVAPGGIPYWKKRFGHISYLLFVGSAHPPNATGFNDMLKPQLTMLAPDERIVVVGGVCSLLPEMEMFKAAPGLNETRVESVGSQDSGGLSSLIELSKGFILPITGGGGTNLKTAEALYSQRSVVATSLAFRGFERFCDFPNVYIADEPAEFKSRIVDVLRGNCMATEYNSEQIMELERLTWPHAVLPLNAFVSKLLEGSATEDVSNNRITFSGQNLAAALAGGWNQYEATNMFVWSSERIAILRFEGAWLRSGQFVVVLRFSVFNPQKAQIAVKIYSQRRRLTEVFVRSDDEQTLEFRIGDDDKLGTQTLEIYIEVGKIHSPAMYGGVDYRVLGVRLMEIEFERRLLDLAGKVQQGRTLVHQAPQGVRGCGPAISERGGNVGDKRLFNGAVSLTSFLPKLEMAKFHIDMVGDEQVSPARNLKVSNSEFRSVQVAGWAVNSKRKSVFSKVVLMFRGIQSYDVVDIQAYDRPDVAMVFKEPNLTACGVKFGVPSGMLPGRYRLIFVGYDHNGKMFKNQ